MKVSGKALILYNSTIFLSLATCGTATELVILLGYSQVYMFFEIPPYVRVNLTTLITKRIRI